MSDTAEIRKRRIYRVTFIGFVVNLVLVALKLAAGILGRSGAMIADARAFVLRSGHRCRRDRLCPDFGQAPGTTGMITATASMKPLPQSSSASHWALWAPESSSTASGPSGWCSTAGCCPGPDWSPSWRRILSIAAKEILYRYTVREGRAIDSPSVIANAWHHRSDALSSLGTLVGIGCAYFLGDRWRIADPIAALIVVVFIFQGRLRPDPHGIGRTARKVAPRGDGAGDPAHRDARSRRSGAAQPSYTAHRSRHRHRGACPRRRGDVRRLFPRPDGRYRAPSAGAFGEETMIAVHVEPLK